MPSKYIRLGEYKGVPCTEVVHWGGKVIAIFPEFTPDELFADDIGMKDFLKILEEIYLTEKWAVKLEK